jgi:hypothetical protein
MDTDIRFLNMELFRIEYIGFEKSRDKISIDD